MRNSVILSLLLILSDACVDRLSFDVGDLDGDVLVVDGVITDQPGPYTVSLFKASKADGILNFKRPIIAKQVTIFDNEGTTEVLSTSGEGLYKTSDTGIKGTVGHKYSLRIELADGSVFESTPDEMKPVGAVDSIYFRFESFLPLHGPTVYGFRVFMDASNKLNEDNFIRWRVTGVYKFRVFPGLHKLRDACPPSSAPPDPLPCSGYTFDGARLVYDFDNPCTCCECWVNDRENKPYLSDKVIATDGTYKEVEIAFVPFEPENFSFGKYMIKVEQMSLSSEAFEFWKIIKDQKEGVSSLFQPAFGKTRTNFSSANSEQEVIGMFYASSLNTKVKFITSSDAPLPVPTPSIKFEDACYYWDSCEKVFQGASRIPPPEWQ